MIDTTPSRRAALRAQTRAAFHMTSCGMTDTGRVRASNEDRFLIAPLFAAGPGATAGHLFAVADGVGGARGGEVASALTMETIEGSVPALRKLCQERTPRPARVFDALRTLFHRADERLLEEIERRPGLRGMATTLTVGVNIGRTLFVGHAGDSRCYVLRAGALRRITIDQTVAVELARSGLVEPEHVADHPFRNVLSNYIGIGPKLDVEVHEVDLSLGDSVLLCSDGLTGMVQSHAIAAILGEAETPEQACRDLVASANEAGGEDNVTVIVARCAIAA